MENCEEYIRVAGKWGKYQIAVSVIVILTFMYIPLVVLTLPMMQKVPAFKWMNGTEAVEIDQHTFCRDIYYTESFDEMEGKIIVDDSFRTWASDLKIVCNTKNIFSLIGTFYFLASIASYLALSKFPDRYGRRNIFMYFNLFSLIAYVQMIYLNNFGQILIAAFVSGLSALNLAIGSVILNENVDGRHTAFIIGIGMAMFPLGGMINTFFMYFLGDWRYYFVLTLILLCITNYLCFAVLKESPRWLNANNYSKDLVETLMFIAEINGTSNELKDVLRRDNPNLKRKSSVLMNAHNGHNEEYRKHIYGITDLVTFKSLRTITLANIYLWVVSGFSFYGLLLNLEGLTGNIYVDSIIAYSAEFFADLASGYIADRYGRKKTIFWSFVLSALGSAFFPISSYYISLPLLFVSCIGVASAFNVMYIFSAELYPTNIKSLATSIFFVSNRLSAGTVPIILTFIPNVIFLICVLSIGAIFVVSFLPETLGRDTGDEIEELKGKIYEDLSNELIDENIRINSDTEMTLFHNVFENSY